MDEGTDPGRTVPEGSDPPSGSEAPKEVSPEVSAGAASEVTPPAVQPPPSAEQPPLTTPAAATSGRKGDEERRRALAQAIQNEVVQGGRIESQSEFQAVIVFGKPVNHLLQLGLSVVTCGIWLLVWLGLVIFGGENRVMVSVDEYGNVLRQKIK